MLLPPSSLARSGCHHNLAKVAKGPTTPAAITRMVCMFIPLNLDQSCVKPSQVPSKRNLLLKQAASSQLLFSVLLAADASTAICRESRHPSRRYSSPTSVVARNARTADSTAPGRSPPQSHQPDHACRNTQGSEPLGEVDCLTSYLHLHKLPASPSSVDSQQKQQHVLHMLVHAWQHHCCH